MPAGMPKSSSMQNQVNAADRYDWQRKSMMDTRRRGGSGGEKQYSHRPGMKDDDQVQFSDFGALEGLFNRPFGPLLNLIALLCVWVYRTIMGVFGFVTAPKGKRSFRFGSPIQKSDMDESSCSKILLRYNSEIDNAVEEGNLARGEEILQEMLQEGVAPNGFSYSCMAKGCCKAQLPRKALKYLNLMLDAKMRPEMICIRMVLEVNARAGDTVRIEGLMKRLAGERIEIGAWGFRAMIEGCTRSGDIDQAEIWVDRMMKSPMVREGEEIASGLAAAAIAIAKARAPGRAAAVVQRAEELGLALEVTTYEVVVKSLARQGDGDKAEAWLDHLLSLPQRPAKRESEPATVGADLDTYHAVMHALAQKGEKERVEKWLERMPVRGRAGGQSPNAVSYNICIDACAKGNDATGAEKWLSKMRDAGVNPSAVSYNAVIHACARAGEVQRATEWLKVMMEDPNGESPEVNVFTWSTVIHACAKAGDADQAEQWLAKMRESGTEPNAITYNCVIDACAKAGEVPRAERWMETMKKNGIAPTAASYNSVLHACASSGDPQGAEDWLKKMAQAGVMPTAHSYNSCVHAWGNAGNTQRAAAIFQMMREQGIKGSVVSYSSLVRPYARKGNYEEVERIMEAMESDGHQVNDFFLNQMLCAYANARPPQPERAEAAFRKAMKCKVKLNEFLHTSVRNALGKERAEALLSELNLPINFERTAASMAGKYAKEYNEKRKSNASSNASGQGSQGQRRGSQGDSKNNDSSSPSKNSRGGGAKKETFSNRRSTSPGSTAERESSTKPSNAPVKGRSNADENWRAS